jgi:streptogramin lyase
MASFDRKIALSCLSLASLTGVLLVAIPSSAATNRVSMREFDSPSGLTVAGGRLWVANEASSTLTEIDPATGSWIATYGSPGYGFDHPTAITSINGALFVANADNSVTEVRASTGALVRHIAGASYRFSQPVAITTVGNDVVVLNAGVAGSLTEFSASTGAFIMNVRGPAYAFDQPAALAVAGNDLVVADQGNNSVTEVNATNGRLIRVVTGHGLSSPDGVAIGSGNIWVADKATSAATDISLATGAVLATKTDHDGGYGFWGPTVMISTGVNVYVATPLGTSPMVTKISATSGKPYWFMCNTNGPYYFSLLSAFAISGDNLWVASHSGANSKTPGAATGSLTELSLGSGALLRTLPAH